MDSVSRVPSALKVNLNTMKQARRLRNILYSFLDRHVRLLAVHVALSLRLGHSTGGIGIETITKTVFVGLRSAIEHAGVGAVPIDGFKV